MVVAGMAVVVTAVAVYTSAGVSHDARRAQARLDVIDGTLNRLPLSSVTVGYEWRNPSDRNEAETAIKANRLGQVVAYFLFCGDQCPGWQPGDPVEVIRSDRLGSSALSGRSCDRVGQGLRSVAGLHAVPPGLRVSQKVTCSFAGCIGVVGVRADFLGVDGYLDDVELRGIIGTPQLGMVDPPPACPHA